MTGHTIDRTDTGTTCSCGHTFIGAPIGDLWRAVIAHLRSADIAAFGAATQRRKAVA